MDLPKIEINYVYKKSATEFLVIYMNNVRCNVVLVFRGVDGFHITYNFSPFMD